HPRLTHGVAAPAAPAHDSLCAFNLRPGARPRGDAVHYPARRGRIFSSALRIFPRTLRRGCASGANDDRPAPLHGADAIRHGHSHHHSPAPDEFCSWLDFTTTQHLCGFRPSRAHLRLRNALRLPRSQPFARTKFLGTSVTLPLASHFLRT